MALPPALLIALQFLSCLPLRVEPWPQDAEVGRSLLWYPLVGLLLGLLLVLAGVLLQGLPAAVAAALLLALWVAITGALHLDGLADTVDAWIGGRGERERTLALMKDPCCGPMAVVALVVLLLLKFVALQELLQRDGLALLLAPLLGRCALLLLFLGTPYVRAGGLGSLLAQHLPRAAGWRVLALGLLPALLCGPAGWLALAAAAVVFVLWRKAMLARIGGTTGDTAGAMVELVELATLLVLLC